LSKSKIHAKTSYICPDETDRALVGVSFKRKTPTPTTHIYKQLAVKGCDADKLTCS